jgi:hypothetical protein
MGNLARQTWDEIVNGPVASATRRKVAACSQNCWMVTTARTAMRSRVIPQAPKMGPLVWVLKNKAKLALGRKICFDSYIDYSDVRVSPSVARQSFLENKMKARLVKGRTTVDEHYPLKSFVNN